MRIVVTGATGAIGRSTIPRLVAAGHDVVGLFHRPSSAGWLRRQCAEPQHVDLFDPQQVGDVIRGADAAIHLATSIPPAVKMTKARHWAMNDRLRRDATRILVEAAEREGVAQLITESITFNYVDRGDHWITEDDPVSSVFEPTASALVAEHHIADFAARGGVGVTLRFAHLYGPGAVSADVIAALRSRKLPLVGAGHNFVSSIHVDDAGAAVAAALGASSGIYNVADDKPLRARDRLELQVRAISAPEPRHVPVPLARLLVGKAAHQLTVSHRVLNRRFRDESGWSPKYPSIGDGWVSELEDDSADRTLG